jgi:hypothetical protein
MICINKIEIAQTHKIEYCITTNISICGSTESEFYVAHNLKEVLQAIDHDLGDTSRHNLIKDTKACPICRKKFEAKKV